METGLLIFSASSFVVAMVLVGWANALTFQMMALVNLKAEGPRFWGTGGLELSRLIDAYKVHYPDGDLWRRAKRLAIVGMAFFAGTLPGIFVIGGRVGS